MVTAELSQLLRQPLWQNLPPVLLWVASRPNYFHHLRSVEKGLILQHYLSTRDIGVHAPVFFIAVDEIYP